MPPDYPHLSRAPAVEAVLDIRTVLPPDTDVKRFSDVGPSLLAEYPHAREMQGFGATFSVSADNARIEQIPDWLRGYMLHSADDLYRVQFRQDGFTFNRLKPYTEWKDIVSRARRGWDEYRKLARPRAVTRIALRYINRFELELPVELRDYLVAAPDLPPAAPQGLSSFLWRWVVRDDETGIMCNLSEASEPVTTAQTVGVILDIDCYVEESIEPHSPRVFERLAQLRDMKNRIFFGSLTPRALDLFR